MTVAELIEELNKMTKDSNVYAYGDGSIHGYDVMSARENGAIVVIEIRNA